MKEKILEISKRLERSEITWFDAKKEFLILFNVSDSALNEDILDSAFDTDVFSINSDFGI